MNLHDMELDERTIAVSNAGYRWSYLVLSFGILISVAVRSFTYGESSWDLLTLVVLGGVVNAAYQHSQRVLPRKWVAMTLVTMAIAAVLAALMILVRSGH